MKHKILYLFLLLVLPLMAWAENASNIRVHQRNKDIVITYDLNKISNVRVFISNGDNLPFVPLKAVDGAVGNRVNAGKDLEIVWHPLDEMDRFISENVRFKVEAKGVYEEYALRRSNGGKTNMETFITVDLGYSPAPQLNYGFMLGQTYRGYGWFVDMRSNFHFLSAEDGLVCDEKGYVNNILPFYSGKTQSSSLMFNAGFVMDCIEVAGGSPNNRFNTLGFYLGAGYGFRRNMWETTDGKWIEYGPNSYKGFSGNIGLIGSIYGFTLKVGVSTISFQYLELEAGIGWIF